MLLTQNRHDCGITRNIYFFDCFVHDRRILSEFDLNGISGEDVKVLRAIRSVLNRLTDQEMQRVLQMLTEARQAPDQNNQQVANAPVSRGQKLEKIFDS